MNITHTHRNWYGKKIVWHLTEICSTGRKVQYSDSSGSSWLRDEKIYQCPVCKKIIASYH